MLIPFLFRGFRELSPRIAFKALRLWVWKGLFALRAFKHRLKKGELFPPFLFFALTGACNLRCRGCWIRSAPAPDSAGETAADVKSLPGEIPFDDVDRAIREAGKRSVYFHTLLGGEPFLYPRLFELIGRHPECYFQIITNGQFFDVETVTRLRRLGNVSPLVSIDGLRRTNDDRRGEGTFETAIEGCRELRRQKLLYGVATVVTAENIDEVLTEEYVRRFIDLGAMYLWYYVFRPVGNDPSPHLCLDVRQMLDFRTRLLRLRRKMPIILIDTYWDADGVAVCPAAKGLGFHIGPDGGIEPCPPLSVCRERITDHGGDLFRTIDGSRFLRDFQRFVDRAFTSPSLSEKGPNAVSDAGRGCVILQHPQALAAFFREHEVADRSGGDLCAELEAAQQRTSHHLPESEIPEDFWLYRMLKKTLFFGMGGYG